MILKKTGPQNTYHKERNDHINRNIRNIKDFKVIVEKLEAQYKRMKISYDRNVQYLNRAKASLDFPKVFRCRKNCKIKEMC